MNPQADTAGLEVVGTLTQRMRGNPHPGTYLGKGKLRELRRMCGLPDVEDYRGEEEEGDGDGDGNTDWDEDGDGGDVGETSLDSGSQLSASHPIIGTGDGVEGEAVDSKTTKSATAAAAKDKDDKDEGFDGYDDDSWGEEWNEEGEAAAAAAEEQRPKLTKKEWEAKEPTVDTIVIDSELSPRQAKNLSQMLDGKVLVCDRTMLILDIFSQRARTAEGQLQVYTSNPYNPYITPI